VESNKFVLNLVDSIQVYIHTKFDPLS